MTSRLFPRKAYCKGVVQGLISAHVIGKHEGFTRVPRGGPDPLGQWYLPLSRVFKTHRSGIRRHGNNLHDPSLSCQKCCALKIRMVRVAGCHGLEAVCAKDSSLDSLNVALYPRLRYKTGHYHEKSLMRSRGNVRSVPACTSEGVGGHAFYVALTFCYTRFVSFTIQPSNSWVTKR